MTEQELNLKFENLTNAGLKSCFREADPHWLHTRGGQIYPNMDTINTNTGIGFRWILAQYNQYFVQPPKLFRDRHILAPQKSLKIHEKLHNMFCCLLVVESKNHGDSVVISLMSHELLL